MAAAAARLADARPCPCTVHLFLQNGLAEATQKSRKQIKERKNRTKSLRGVKKNSGGEWICRCIAVVAAGQRSGCHLPVLYFLLLGAPLLVQARSKPCCAFFCNTPLAKSSDSNSKQNLHSPILDASSTGIGRAGCASMRRIIAFTPSRAVAWNKTGWCSVVAHATAGRGAWAAVNKACVLWRGAACGDSTARGRGGCKLVARSKPVCRAVGWAGLACWRVGGTPGAAAATHHLGRRRRRQHPPASRPSGRPPSGPPIPIHPETHPPTHRPAHPHSCRPPPPPHV